MDKNYCLSTPLHWIPKILFIPTTCNICKIKPFTQMSLLFQLKQKATEYELLTSMLNSKSAHRKEYFFYVMALDWKSQKPHPTSPFLCQKAKARLWNKLTYGRFFHGFITRATWNGVPWILYYAQLVEQLVTQQLNLWASSWSLKLIVKYFKSYWQT